ncbi:MAG: septum formation inhibitor Maf [Oscillospiraceae bacterium]|nr:septum formation inhibitor Maf [Oscillospiraceae bacterium]
MLWVLASGSPRRIELLNSIGLNPRVIPADIDESAVKETNPRRMVTQLAMLKALHVAKRYSGKDILCIGADTCVYIDENILGKPKNEAEAAEMLRTLSGRTHEVYTGFAAVRCTNMDTVADSQVTKVRFKPLSEEEIAAYIKSGEPMDKAGAYGIQEKGSLLIEGIEGDYFNVVGLPVCKLGETLKKEFGIEILK